MASCPDCGEQLPAADYEGKRHTCTCGRRFVTYTIDFSSTRLRYRWTQMPQGEYEERPWLPGVPIVEDKGG